MRQWVLWVEEEEVSMGMIEVGGFFIVHHHFLSNKFGVNVRVM